MDHKTRKPSSMTRELVEDSTGNVFADMGMADADGRLAKAQLAQRISQIIKSRKLSQKEAAATLGIDQPKVSALLRGRLKDFSTDRLMRFIISLDQDVIITIQKPANSARRRGRMLVRV